MKRQALTLFLLAATLLAVNAQTTRYWDNNGTTAGAGSGGTWGTTWNTTAAGTTTAPGGWTAGDTARLAAGSDLLGVAYTITLAGPQTVGKIVPEEGQAVLITGSTITLSGGAGTRQIDTAFANTSQSLRIDSVLAGTAGLEMRLLITSAGTITLGGANTYSGATTMLNGSGGNVRNGASEVIPNGSDVELGRSGLSANNWFLDNFTETINSLTGFGSSVVNLGTGTLTINNGASKTYPGVISGTGGNLIKAGSGTQTLSGVNTFTGTVTVNAGVLAIASATALGTAAGNTTVTAGALNVSGTLTFAEPLTLNGTGIASGGALRNTANNNTWSGPITLGSSGVRINSDAATLTLSGGITGSGNPNLTLGGAGTITVNTSPINIGTGIFTWDGSAASLRLDTANTIGTFNYNATIIKFNNSTAAGQGTINVNTATGTGEFSVTGGFFPVVANEIVLATGANPQLYAASGASLELTGLVSGNGGWRRTDTGAVNPILSGNNSFGGGVLVISRGITLGHKSALGTGTFTIGDPVTAPATAITIASKSGVNISGANAVINAITINRSVTLGGTDPLEFSGNITLATTASPTITVTNPAATILSGPISGTGFSITKAGAGTLTLSGNNTYDTGTTITLGTLLVNNTVGSGTGSGTVIVNGGVLGGTGTVGGAVTVNSGGTLAPGVSIGTLTLATPPTLSGTTFMEIDRGASPNADKLVVSSGTLTNGGTLTVTNIGGTLAAGDTFDLFDAGAFFGAFSATNLPPLPSGLRWNTSQLAIDGTITVVNNIAPVAIDDPITRSGGTSGTKVSISALLANDTDAEGDTLTLSVFDTTSTRGATLQQVGGFIVYTTSTAIDVADSFTYTISDGFGGTDIGTVNVSVTAAPAAARVVPPVGTDGDVFLKFAGIPGTPYSVQHAEDVSGPWTTIGSSTPVSSPTYLEDGITVDLETGFGRYHDTVPRLGGEIIASFYRIIYP